MTKFLLSIAFIVLTCCQSVELKAQVFDPPAAQPNVAAPAALQTVATTQDENVKQTGWAGIPLPKVTLPKLTLPKVTLPSVDSVTAPMKASFNKVTTGTKKAWEGTKEMLSFGKKKEQAGSATRTSQKKKASFWQRLVAKPEPEGPRTVNELLSQPRLKP